jgi:ATP-binding cassette subfamily B protein
MGPIRKILVYVQPYWKLAAVSLVLLTVQVFLDLAIPRLIQQIIDKGINQNNMSMVLQTSVWMLVITLGSTLTAVGNNIFSVRAGEGVARDIREALFTRIQSFSYGNLDHFTTGKLMVRLSSDARAVQHLVQISLRIGTRGPLMMIGSIILMFNTDRQLAMTMLPLLMVTGVVIAVFSVKLQPFFKLVQQKLDRLNTVLQENIAGARVVKAFVRADFESRRFEETNEDYTRQTVSVMKAMSSMMPVLTMLVNIGMVTVIWSGGLQAIRGELTVGQIVAFTNYLLTTMGPLTMMGMLANTWANGFASWARIREVLDTEPEVQEQPGARRLPETVRGRVEFENVEFHYNGSVDQQVLTRINLKAEPGQTVAVLGATGAGKSSLVNLIPRFYDVSGGRVMIDGMDVRSLEEDSLLAQIAVVPQETVLFSGSVRENIAYGKRDAREEEIIAAAKAAQAHDFILKLPNGYDTRVEERGVNLSGGQKQRIAIARALLVNPSILILDDSTSSVDVETETKIQNAMRELRSNRTSFVVAQRISTVLKADKIVVIDRGEVAAQGTHAELMQFSPIYQEIYDSQLGDGVRADSNAVKEAGGVM